MLNYDRAAIENILLQLEDKGFFDSKLQYRFYREEGKLCLLGVGGSSYVFEMYDSVAPDRHYAIKIMGFGDREINADLVTYSAQIQYQLSEVSETIARVIALWTMKISIDDNGDVIGLVGINEDGFETAEGMPIQMILMEKLESIISKDKYGNIELVREDLKSEVGVINFAQQIGRALFTVHENSFLHRDVKLENIFWNERTKKYVLGDFGTARYIDEGGAETVLFTDGYGAPEIERRLSESYYATADIYSFGITLFLLLNDLKFPGSDSYRANLVQYERDFVIPAPKYASDGMAHIIRKMCSYRVADRFQSIEEVLMEIGRLDGSYSEQGFVEEFVSVKTETYLEEDALTETYREENGGSDQDYGELEDVPWWEKAENELTHEERKKRAQSYEKSYRDRSIFRLCICAILFFCLNKAFVVESAFAVTWQLWMLLVAFLAESIFQKIKEFHVAFGVMCVGMVAFSAITTGTYIPLIAMAIVMLLGIPALTAGSAMGVGIWAIITILGKFEWLEFLCRLDIGWIIILCIVATMESYVLMRADYNKTLMLSEKTWLWITDKIWYLLIGGGIATYILKRFASVNVPDFVDQLHLIRLGIGIFLIQILYFWYYGLLDEDSSGGEDAINEPMDK